MRNIFEGPRFYKREPQSFTSLDRFEDAHLWDLLPKARRKAGLIIEADHAITKVSGLTGEIDDLEAGMKRFGHKEGGIDVGYLETKTAEILRINGSSIQLANPEGRKLFVNISQTKKPPIARFTLIEDIPHMETVYLMDMSTNQNSGIPERYGIQVSRLFRSESQSFAYSESGAKSERPVSTSTGYNMTKVGEIPGLVKDVVGELPEKIDFKATMDKFLEMCRTKQYVPIKDLLVTPSK